VDDTEHRWLPNARFSDNRANWTMSVWLAFLTQRQLLHTWRTKPLVFTRHKTLLCITLLHETYFTQILWLQFVRSSSSSCRCCVVSVTVGLHIVVVVVARLERWRFWAQPRICECQRFWNLLNSSRADTYCVNSFMQTGCLRYYLYTFVLHANCEIYACNTLRNLRCSILFLVSHFPVPHIPPLHFAAEFSSPAFSFLAFSAMLLAMRSSGHW